MCIYVCMCACVSVSKHSTFMVVTNEMFVSAFESLSSRGKCVQASWAYFPMK